MKGEGISDSIRTERKVEIRVRKNGRKDKVIVEKSAAEGLPEGWIKKLVITHRTGRKNRRDPFFIDPKREYIFQSFKDASRYVETGVIGHYARILKDIDIENDDTVNGKTVPLLESAEKRSADDVLEKSINIYVRSSKQRNLASSDEQYENGEMNSHLSRETRQVLMDLGRKEEAKDPIEKQPIMKRVTRSQAKASKDEEDCCVKIKTTTSSNAKTEKHAVKPRSRNEIASSQDQKKKTFMKKEKVQDYTEKRITRSSAKAMKNELSNSVTRRASKRLAGTELEPTPELKTRTKVQRVVSPGDFTAGKSNQPVDPVVIDGLKKTDISLNKEVAKSCNKHSSPKSNAAAASSNNCGRAELEMQIEKMSKPVGRNGSGDKMKMKTPLLISETEVNSVFHLYGYKEKEEMSPVSPLSVTKREKTAAGKRLGSLSPKANKVTSPKAAEISPQRLSNKGEHLHPSCNGNAIQKRNKISSEVSVVRGACSEVMEKNTNSFSSAFDSTLADLWKDPCIAFAIKTLTGESLHLPNNIATSSSDPNNNHDKQKGGGVSFFPETPGNVNMGSAKPGLPSEPGADIWKDPCIDFAIKTLTGAIPIGLDETGNMERKSVEKSGDLRFPQSFSKN